MHPVRVGTCGWSYKEWSGVFYPEDLSAAEYLPYLAQRFGASAFSFWLIFIAGLGPTFAPHG